MIGEFFIIKNKVEKYIADNFSSENDKILDIGCGEDPNYHEFMKGSVICLDISKKPDILLRAALKIAVSLI